MQPHWELAVLSLHASQSTGQFTAALRMAVCLLEIDRKCGADMGLGANSGLGLQTIHPKSIVVAGQVPIPRPLARQMLGAAAADLALTWAWEHALRAAFPAPRPPAKGYQAFARELAALDKGGQQGRGRLKAE